MKHRKLRIAWSVAWGIVAVLLVVLWVRSYTSLDYASVGPVTLRSSPGQFNLIVATRPNGQITYGSAAIRPGDVYDPGNWWLGFFAIVHNGLYLVAPYWFLISATALFAVGPWIQQLRFQFSLRTVLIATTLFAILLGTAIWLSH